MNMIETTFPAPQLDSPYEYEREPIHIRTSLEWIRSKLKNNHYPSASHDHFFIVQNNKHTKLVIHFEIPKSPKSHRVYVTEYSLYTNNKGEKVSAERYEYDVENVSSARTLYAHWIAQGYSPIQ